MIFHAWMRQALLCVMCMNHACFMIQDWDMQEKRTLCWSMLVFYIDLHACIMHGAGVYHAQQWGIPCLYHALYWHVPCMYCACIPCVYYAQYTMHVYASVLYASDKVCVWWGHLSNFTSHAQTHNILFTSLAKTIFLIHLRQRITLCRML